MSIEQEEVFDAIRRGYTDLSQASDTEIESYFEDVDSTTMSGHISNIKGILFEEEYIEKLHSRGINAALFEETNHPISDVMIYNDNGEVIEELQLKATENSFYVKETLLNIGDEIKVVSTMEVADKLGEEVVDSGISDAALEEAINDALIPVSPISLIGALFGLWV